MGAGAYDKNRFAKDLLSQDQDLNFMGTYLWVLDESDTTFLRALMENQIEGWPAQASIYFFRGSEDKIWNVTQTYLAAQAIEN